MNQAEHQLIVTMLQQQRRAFAVLVEILRSRGIIQDGDMLAFDELLAKIGKAKILEDEVATAYRGFGTVLGLTVGELLEEE